MLRFNILLTTLLRTYLTDMYSTLCTVHADTSHVLKKKQIGPNGPYYSQDFNVILLCGLTELRAQISWMENVRSSVVML